MTADVPLGLGLGIARALAYVYLWQSADCADNSHAQRCGRPQRSDSALDLRRYREQNYAANV